MCVIKGWILVVELNFSRWRAYTQRRKKFMFTNFFETWTNILFTQIDKTLLLYRINSLPKKRKAKRNLEATSITKGKPFYTYIHRIEEELARLEDTFHDQFIIWHFFAFMFNLSRRVWIQSKAKPFLFVVEYFLPYSFLVEE